MFFKALTGTKTRHFSLSDRLFDKFQHGLGTRHLRPPTVGHDYPADGIEDRDPGESGQGRRCRAILTGIRKDEQHPADYAAAAGASGSLPDLDWIPGRARDDG